MFNFEKLGKYREHYNNPHPPQVPAASSPWLGILVHVICGSNNPSSGFLVIKGKELSHLPHLWVVQLWLSRY